MKEAYLHYIWLTQSFNSNELKLFSGETLKIISPGVYNKNSDGPDFLFAKIQIDTIQLVGHIEIHTLCTHWFAHKHQNDSNYSNVILHVVHTNNCKENQLPIPTLELKERLNYTSYEQWLLMDKSSAIYPCSSFVNNIPEFVLSSTLYQAFFLRLERKCNWITDTFSSLNERDLLKVLTSRVMGNVINAEAFVQWTAEHWLDKQSDTSPKSLVKFKSKGVRPGSQPERRLIQLRWLFENWELLQFQIEYIDDYKSFRKKWLQTLNKFAPIPFTNFVADQLFINAILLTMFHKATKENDEVLKNRIVQLYDQIPAEKNSIVDKWKSQMFKVNSALESQAVLEWTAYSCKLKKCLQCPIGHKCVQGH